MKKRREEERKKRKGKEEKRKRKKGREKGREGEAAVGRHGKNIFPFSFSLSLP